MGRFDAVLKDGRYQTLDDNGKEQVWKGLYQKHVTSDPRYLMLSEKEKEEAYNKFVNKYMPNRITPEPQPKPEQPTLSGKPLMYDVLMKETDPLKRVEATLMSQEQLTGRQAMLGEAKKLAEPSLAKLKTPEKAGYEKGQAIARKLDNWEDALTIDSDNPVAKFVNEFTGAMTDTIAGLATSVASVPGLSVTSPVLEMIGNPYGSQMIKGMVDKAYELHGYGAEDMDIMGALRDMDLPKAAGIGFKAFVQSAPQTAAWVMNPYLGMGAAFATSGTGKYLDMEREYPELGKGAAIEAGVVVGTMEALSEHIGNVFGLGKTLKLGKNLPAAAMKKVLKRELGKRTYMGIAKQWGIEAGIEGIEEMPNFAAEYLMDIHNGIAEWNPQVFRDGLINAGLLGAAAGGWQGGIGAGRNVLLYNRYLNINKKVETLASSDVSGIKDIEKRNIAASMKDFAQKTQQAAQMAMNGDAEGATELAKETNRSITMMKMEGKTNKVLDTLGLYNSLILDSIDSVQAEQAPAEQAQPAPAPIVERTPPTEPVVDDNGKPKIGMADVKTAITAAMQSRTPDAIDNAKTMIDTMLPTALDADREQLNTWKSAVSKLKPVSAKTAPTEPKAPPKPKEIKPEAKPEPVAEVKPEVPKPKPAKPKAEIKDTGNAKEFVVPDSSEKRKELIELTRDMIATKKAKGERIPEHYNENLARLLAAESGVSVSDEDILSNVVWGHPQGTSSNMGTDKDIASLIPIKVKKGRDLTDRITRAEAILDKLQKKIGEANALANGHIKGTKKQVAEAKNFLASMDATETETAIDLLRNETIPELQRLNSLSMANVKPAEPTPATPEPAPAQPAPKPKAEAKAAPAKAAEKAVAVKKATKQNVTTVQDKNIPTIFRSLKSNKYTLPILKNMFKGEENKEYLVGTNLDTTIYIKSSMPNGLYKFVGKNIEKSTDDETSYPVHPNVDKVYKEAKTKIDITPYLKDIYDLSFASSTDVNRPVLTGVNIYYEGGVLSMVSTDGRKVMERTYKVNLGETPFNSNIPASSIAVIKKFGITDIGMAILKDDVALFNLSGNYVHTRTIDNEYPKYAPALDFYDGATMFTINREKLSKALESIIPYTNKETGAVHISQSDNGIMLEAYDKDTDVRKTITVEAKSKPYTTADYDRQYGNLDMLMPLRSNGEEAFISMNAKYLKGMIDTSTEDTIDIASDVKLHRNPNLITLKKTAGGIVSPLKIKQAIEAKETHIKKEENGLLPFDNQRIEMLNRIAGIKPEAPKLSPIDTFKQQWRDAQKGKLTEAELDAQMAVFDALTETMAKELKISLDELYATYLSEVTDKGKPDEQDMLKKVDGIVRGYIRLLNGKAGFTFLDPDITTGFHEMAHLGREFIGILAENDSTGKWQNLLKDAEAYCGVKDGVWTKEADEKFAVSFERYMYDGVAPTSKLKTVFEKVRQWIAKLVARVQTLEGYDLIPEIINVYNVMLGGEYVEAKAAQGSRVAQSLTEYMDRHEAQIQQEIDNYISQLAKKRLGKDSVSDNEEYEEFKKMALEGALDKDKTYNDLIAKRDKPYNEFLDGLRKAVSKNLNGMDGTRVFELLGIDEGYPAATSYDHIANAITRIEQQDKDLEDSLRYAIGEEYVKQKYGKTVDYEGLLGATSGLHEKGKSSLKKEINDIAASTVETFYNYIANTSTAPAPKPALTSEQKKQSVLLKANLKKEQSVDPAHLEKQLDTIANDKGLILKAKKTGANVAFYITDPDGATLIEVHNEGEGYNINGFFMQDNGDVIAKANELLSKVRMQVSGFENAEAERQMEAVRAKYEGTEWHKSLPTWEAITRMNNVIDTPYDQKIKEGALFRDPSGDDPYIYETRYVNPKDYIDKVHLEGETYDKVVSMPTTQKYIEWYKQGYEPPPMSLVAHYKNGLSPTERRRWVAAIEAGVKKVPALVEIGRASEMPNHPGYLKAPNGKPSKLNERQWLQVRTPNFIAWFGDWLNDPKNASKVVDENGEPMVVYHGTGARNDFSVFKETSGKMGVGIYFTANSEFANQFTGSRANESMGLKPRIVPAFLNIRKMADGESTDHTANMLAYQDYYQYDGGVANRDEKDNQYIVFSPTQIKSATGNVGTFDAENPDIRYQAVKDAKAAQAKKHNAILKAYEKLRIRLKENGKNIQNWNNILTYAVNRSLRIQNSRAVPYDPVKAAMLFDFDLMPPTEAELKRTSDIDGAKQMQQLLKMREAKHRRMLKNDQIYKDLLKKITGFTDISKVPTINLFAALEKLDETAYKAMITDGTVMLLRETIPALAEMREFADTAYTDDLLYQIGAAIINGKAATIAAFTKSAIQSHRLLIRALGKGGVTAVQLATKGERVHSEITHHIADSLKELHDKLNTAKNARKARYTGEECKQMMEIIYDVQDDVEITDKQAEIKKRIAAKNPNINTDDVLYLYDTALEVMDYFKDLIEIFNADPNHTRKIGIRENYLPRIYRLGYGHELSAPSEGYLHWTGNTQERTAEKADPSKMDVNLYKIIRSYSYQMAKVLSYADLAAYVEKRSKVIGMSVDKKGEEHPIYKEKMSPLTEQLDLATANVADTNDMQKYVESYVKAVIGYGDPKGTIDRVISGVKNNAYVALLAYNMRLTLQNYMQKLLIYTAVDGDVANAAVKHVNAITGRIKGKEDKTPLLQQIMRGYVIHNRNLISETTAEQRYNAEAAQSKAGKMLADLSYLNGKLLSTYSPFQYAEHGNRGWGHAAGVLQVVMRTEEYKQAIKAKKSWAQAVEAALANPEIYNAAETMGAAVNAEINADADVALAPALYQKGIGKYLTFVRYGHTFLQLMHRVYMPKSMRSEWNEDLYRLNMSGNAGAITQAEKLRAVQIAVKWTSPKMIKELLNQAKITEGKADIRLSRAEMLRVHKYFNELLGKYTTEAQKNYPDIARGMKGKAQRMAGLTTFIAQDAILNTLYVLLQNMLWGLWDRDEEDEDISANFLKYLWDATQLARLTRGYSIMAGMFPNLTYANTPEEWLKAWTSWGVRITPGLGVIDNLYKQARKKTMTDELYDILLDQ